MKKKVIITSTNNEKNNNKDTCREVNRPTWHRYCTTTPHYIPVVSSSFVMAFYFRWIERERNGTIENNLKVFNAQKIFNMKMTMKLTIIFLERNEIWYILQRQERQQKRKRDPTLIGK